MIKATGDVGALQLSIDGTLIAVLHYSKLEFALTDHQAKGRGHAP